MQRTNFTSCGMWQSMELVNEPTGIDSLQCEEALTLLSSPYIPNVGLQGLSSPYLCRNLIISRSRGAIDGRKTSPRKEPLPRILRAHLCDVCGVRGIDCDNAPDDLPPVAL